MNGIEGSVSVAGFIKEIAVGQIFMVYLRHQNTYWPAKVVNVSNTSSQYQHPSHLTVEFYSINSYKYSKMLINLKNTPMKQFIPFESVYQQYLKNNKNIKSIQHLAYSPSFQKAMTMAAKDYGVRFKTPKIDKELKRQSLQIPQKITINFNNPSNEIPYNQKTKVQKEKITLQNKEPIRRSIRLENKQVQRRSNNSSIKFSQQLKNKTETIQNTPKTRSKKKDCSNNVPIQIGLNSQETTKTSKARSEVEYFSSVSSKFSNKSLIKQNKCSKKDPIKKRGFNTMKGSVSSKIESQQGIALQHLTKKRKSSKASMSVIYSQPKQEIPKKTLNYCQSQRITNRSKTSESARMENQNQHNKTKKKNCMVIKGLDKEVKNKIQTENTKNQKQKQILSIPSNLSSKTRSQSKKNSQKKSNLLSTIKVKPPKKQPKQLTTKIKLEPNQTQNLENKYKFQTLLLSKEPKYQLLLSRLLFDHSKNKFPILLQKSPSKTLYAREAKVPFSHKSNVEIKSFNELLNFVKQLQQKQTSNKNQKTGFILYEEVKKKKRDPYVLTYSQLSLEDSIQKIVLQDDECKFTSSRHLRSEQWSIQQFLLQSISSLIGSWNIVSLQSKNLFLPINNHFLPATFVNKNQTQRLENSSASKRGKSKSVRKNNSKISRCHQYCYSVGSQEKNLLTNLQKLIRMYFAYQRQCCQNFPLQPENAQQNFNTNSQIFQSQLQRMKKQHRHLSTYHKVIRIQVEQTLKMLPPLLSVQPHQKLKKQQIYKVQQYSQSQSTQEQTVASQEHHVFSLVNGLRSGVNKKTNRQKDIVCWINPLRQQLEELLNFMQRMQNNLASEISRRQKQLQIKCKIHSYSNIFEESLQLPQQKCFEPYESCLAKQTRSIQGKKLSDSHLMQNESDLKEKEFQEFLKRVLNVECLEGVYTDDMHSEVSFSEMQTLKSDILDAFDELQNELTHNQKYEISY